MKQSLKQYFKNNLVFLASFVFSHCLTSLSHRIATPKDSFLRTKQLGGEGQFLHGLEDLTEKCNKNAHVWSHIVTHNSCMNSSSITEFGGKCSAFERNGCTLRGSCKRSIRHLMAQRPSKRFLNRCHRITCWKQWHKNLNFHEFIIHDFWGHIRARSSVIMTCFKNQRCTISLLSLVCERISRSSSCTTPKKLIFKRQDQKSIRQCARFEERNMNQIIPRNFANTWLEISCNILYCKMVSPCIT